MPKSPMTSATRSMPATRFTFPNVKRSVPVTVSCPIVASSAPSPIITVPFRAEPSISSTVQTRPRSMRTQYSGGPKESANSLSSGEKKVRRTSATVPAMNDPVAEMPSAAPARPRLAISCPSRQVTTEAASPGMRTRMEVVEPPYIAP